MTTPNFGTPTPQFNGQNAQQEQVQNPLVNAQSQVPQFQNQPAQAPAPAQAQANPQLAQNEQAAFVPQGDAAIPQPVSLSSIGANSFDTPDVSKYIKMSNYIGCYFFMRIHGIGTRTFSGEVKKSAECDIVVFDPSDLSKAELFSDQGLTNKKVVSAVEILVQRGQTLSCGVIAQGQSRSGNNPPIILQSLNPQDPNFGEIQNYLISYAKSLGWIVD